MPKYLVKTTFKEVHRHIIEASDAKSAEEIAYELCDNQSIEETYWYDSESFEADTTDKADNKED